MILKNTKLGLIIIHCAIIGFAIGFERDSIEKGVVIGVVIGIIIVNINNRKK